MKKKIPTPSRNRFFPVSLLDTLIAVIKPKTYGRQQQNESGRAAGARLKQEVSQPGRIPGDPSWELETTRKQTLEVPHVPESQLQTDLLGGILGFFFSPKVLIFDYYTYQRAHRITQHNKLPHETPRKLTALKIPNTTAWLK